MSEIYRARVIVPADQDSEYMLMGEVRKSMMRNGAQVGDEMKIVLHEYSSTVKIFMLTINRGNA